MELKATITVNKKVADALKNLYNKIDSMDWIYLQMLVLLLLVMKIVLIGV